MSTVSVEVFFYGLFMDTAVLERLGFAGDEPRMAVLADYDLRIGERVTLVPATGLDVHGVVMRMSAEQATQLYALDIVKGYVPEDVNVTLASGDRLDSVCYLLPEADLSSTSQAYAKSLYELGERLGFPADYLARIDAFRATTGATG